MKVKLLRRIRREAEDIFDDILLFGTTNGEVTRIRYKESYRWAISWMLGKRLDYQDDRVKIVCKIARLLWKREKREFWHRKLRPAGKGGAEWASQQQKSRLPSRTR